MVPFFSKGRRRYSGDVIAVPAIAASSERETSTQMAFGKILDELAKGDSDLASRILTVSPDVTGTTSLGPWVNRRKLFAREERSDVFADQRIGTVYDPFVARGLDALNYACYQDARFMIVGTPSGVTLAPEGGAYQSIGSPLIGISQDGLAAFEPAFVDELSVMMA